MEMDNNTFLIIIGAIWIAGFYFSIKQHRERIAKLEEFRKLVLKKFPDIEKDYLDIEHNW